MKGRRSGNGLRADDVIELPAPAKLNLFLHVVGRRADGYHELQTIFQFLDLADRVRIARRNDALLHRTAAIPGVEEADDLVMRAARLLRDTSGIETGADIAVEKRIPLGAGLGGGSSDAAAVLIGLDRLWGLGTDTDRMAALGARLGADVPVFVRGLAAWGEGVGERLVPVALEEPWYVLVVLPLAVSTASVFQAPALTRNTPRIRMNRPASEARPEASESPVPNRAPARLRPQRLRARGEGDAPGGGRSARLALAPCPGSDDRHRCDGVRPVRVPRAGRRGCGRGTTALARDGGAGTESIAAARCRGPGRGAVSACGPFTQLGV